MLLFSTIRPDWTIRLLAEPHPSWQPIPEDLVSSIVDRGCLGIRGQILEACVFLSPGRGRLPAGVIWPRVEIVLKVAGEITTWIATVSAIDNECAIINCLSVPNYLSELSAPERAVFDHSDKTNGDAAEVLGLSVSTVEKHRAAGRRILKLTSLEYDNAAAIVNNRPLNYPAAGIADAPQ